jgi:hypothetical protein
MNAKMDLFHKYSASPENEISIGISPEVVQVREFFLSTLTRDAIVKFHLVWTCKALLISPCSISYILSISTKLATDY